MRLRRRVGRVWFLSSCAVLLIFAIAAVSDKALIVRGILLDIRQLVFGAWTSDAAMFRLAPDAALAAGFKIDSPERLSSFRANLRSVDKVRLETIRQLGFDARIDSVVMFYSVGGKEGQPCTLRASLWDKLDSLRVGRGCCSDHTEAYLGVAALAGLFAREAHSSNHSVVEVWDPDRKTWVFVDAEYGVRAFHGEKPLSVADLNDAVRDSTVSWRFLPVAKRIREAASPQFLEYYATPGTWERPAYVWGANVLAQNPGGIGLRLPISVTQAALGIVGVMPPTIELASPDWVRAKRAASLVVKLGLASWILGFLVLPVGSWYSSRRRTLPSKEL